MNLSLRGLEGRVINKFHSRMITNEMYSSALVALAISGATDWVR